MTTQTEIKETYEPTVADKIQRILYRLDHGEELSNGTLKDEFGFCVLGLFADESGLGYWHENTSDDYSVYVIDGESPTGPFIVSDSIVDHYNLTDNIISFNLDDVRDSNIKDKLIQYDVAYTDGTTSLTRINDYLVRQGRLIEAREILTKLIKSGVVFK